MPTRSFAPGRSICTGTFVAGHGGADAVPAPLAMQRAGSVFAWSVAPAIWPGLQSVLVEQDVEIVRADLEPLRKNSPDAAHVLVARTR